MSGIEQEMIDGDILYGNMHMAALARAISGIGVLRGCGVTEKIIADMSVNVGLGEVPVMLPSSSDPLPNTNIYVPSLRFVPATKNLAIANEATGNPRIDIISVQLDQSSDTCRVTQGTASATPQPPVLPDNDVLLAYVLVPANESTKIENNDIFDMRCYVPGLLLGGGSTGGGMHCQLENFHEDWHYAADVETNNFWEAKGDPGSESIIGTWDSKYGTFLRFNTTPGTGASHFLVKEDVLIDPDNTKIIVLYGRFATDWSKMTDVSTGYGYLGLYDGTNWIGGHMHVTDGVGIQIMATKFMASGDDSWHDFLIEINYPTNNYARGWLDGVYKGSVDITAMSQCYLAHAGYSQALGGAARPDNYEDYLGVIFERDL